MKSGQRPLLKRQRTSRRSICGGRPGSLAGGQNRHLFGRQDCSNLVSFDGSLGSFDGGLDPFGEGLDPLESGQTNPFSPKGIG